jgi:hypothetical protein
MEINVTIFIQALIILMLFVSLSKLLFHPLENLFKERFFLLIGERKQIYKLKNGIINQEYHIKKIDFLIKHKIRRKNKQINRCKNFYKRILKIKSHSFTL